MKKMISALCVALSLFAASVSAASACDAVGSYIAIRSIAELGNLRAMDQLQLHADGTAYYNQSLTFNTPITSGATGPFIGTWQIKKGIIIVTLISFDGGPIAVEDCCDIDTIDWVRNTIELRLVDSNTLERLHGVGQSFLLSADTETVLNAPGTVFTESTNSIIYKKIPVVPSDLL